MRILTIAMSVLMLCAFLPLRAAAPEYELYQPQAIAPLNAAAPLEVTGGGADYVILSWIPAGGSYFVYRWVTTLSNAPAVFSVSGAATFTGTGLDPLSEYFFAVMPATATELSNIIKVIHNGTGFVHTGLAGEYHPAGLTLTGHSIFVAGSADAWAFDVSKTGFELGWSLGPLSGNDVPVGYVIHATAHTDGAWIGLYDAPVIGFAFHVGAGPVNRFVARNMQPNTLYNGFIRGSIFTELSTRGRSANFRVITPPCINNLTFPVYAVAGTAFNEVLTHPVGNRPVTWSISGGNLPPGLSLAGDTISGTPLSTGEYTFTIRAANNRDGLAVDVNPADVAGTGFDEKIFTIAVVDTAPQPVVITAIRGGVEGGLFDIEDSVAVLHGLIGQGGTPNAIRVTAANALTFAWHKNDTPSTAGAVQIAAGPSATLLIPQDLPLGRWYFYAVASNPVYSATSGFFVVNCIQRPVVIGVTPAGADAPVSGSIVITFDMPMDPNTPGVVSLAPGGVLPGGVWSAGNTVFTVPYSGLAYETLHTVNISGFRSAASATMLPDGTGAFTTRAPAVVPVTSVSIDQNDIDLTAGEGQQLTVTVLPTNATNQSVAWSSGNTAVAAVDAAGLVTAISAGTAVITATTQCGGFSDTITVTVAAVVIPATDVSIDQGDINLTADDWQQLSATVLPVNATNQTVAWSSSDIAIATVDAAGLVTAISAGTAVITATTQCGNFTDTITITVVPVTPANVTLTFNPNGGRLRNSADSLHQTIPHGSPLGAYLNAATFAAANLVPVRAGYIFDGWFTPANTLFTLDAPITADTVITARWRAQQIAPPPVDYTPPNIPPNIPPHIPFIPSLPPRLPVRLSATPGPAQDEHSPAPSYMTLAQGRFSVTFYAFQPEEAEPGIVIHLQTASADAESGILDEILHVEINEYAIEIYLTVYVNDLGLTEEQLALLAGIKIGEETGEYFIIQGVLSKDGKYFSFPITQSGLYGILLLAQDDPPPGISGALIFTVGTTEYTNLGIAAESVAAPFIDPETDRMMIPLRTVAESLGVAVDWCDDTASAIIFHPDGTIILPIGGQLPDGMGATMLVNDRTFVPLRFVMYAFGATVEWDYVNRVAVIYW